MAVHALMQCAACVLLVAQLAWEDDVDLRMMGAFAEMGMEERYKAGRAGEPDWGLWEKGHESYVQALWEPVTVGGVGCVVQV
jgi:hypothetical protein